MIKNLKNETITIENTDLNDISVEILNKYLVRKTKVQKENFRNFIIEKLKEHGYEPKIQRKGKSNNVIIGDVDKAKIIYTAHYDTQAVMPYPNLIVPNNLFGFILTQIFTFLCMFIMALPIILTFTFIFNLMPHQILEYIDVKTTATYFGIVLALMWVYYGKANKNTVNDNTSGVITIIETVIKLDKESRDDVCFVLFDNEEIGLVGSTAFNNEYWKSVENKLIINFDCVSDGDNIFFFPNKAIKKDQNDITGDLIKEAFADGDNKKVILHKDGFSFYPSDNLRFKKAYGVCALNKKTFYYMSRIHTPRDVMFDEDNIKLLSDGACRLVGVLKNEKSNK